MDLAAGYHYGHYRDCIYQCYNVSDEGSQKNPINHHWEMVTAGYNYHFCVLHRSYHCMATSSRIDQPCCGECAPAYYKNVPEVTWIRENDYHFSFYSVQSDFLQMMANTSGQGTARSSDSTGDQPTFTVDVVFPLPSDVPDNGPAFDIIPRHTASYLELGSVMMAHRRQSGLILMRFTDYDGLMGWMLCGRSMTQDSFAHLVEVEHNGDPIMKTARLWACQQLGIPMVQDIRWVVWTIYMVSNKALSNPCPTEKEAWFWRSWLWYWYAKANELAAVYHMPISSPEEDWFNQPPSNNQPVARAFNDEAEFSVAQYDTCAPSNQINSDDESSVAGEENTDGNVDSGDCLKSSDSPSTDLWSAESSSTETSSAGTLSEAVVQESPFSMTGLATTLASIDEAESDDDQ